VSVLHGAASPPAAVSALMIGLMLALPDGGDLVEVPDAVPDPAAA